MWDNTCFLWWGIHVYRHYGNIPMVICMSRKSEYRFPVYTTMWKSHVLLQPAHAVRLCFYSIFELYIYMVSAYDLLHLPLPHHFLLHDNFCRCVAVLCTFAFLSYMPRSLIFSQNPYMLTSIVLSLFTFSCNFIWWTTGVCILNYDINYAPNMILPIRYVGWESWISHFMICWLQLVKLLWCDLMSCSGLLLSFEWHV